MPGSPKTDRNPVAGPSQGLRNRSPPPSTRASVTAEEGVRGDPNRSTPRTNRTNDIQAITNLRDEIALQMDGEFVECPVGTFIAHYLPFEHAESDLNAFLTKATYTEPAAAEPWSSTPTDGGRMTRTSSKGKASSVIPPRIHHILEIVKGELRFMEYHVIPTTPGENKTYRYLERIMRAVSEATVNGRPHNGFHYHPCPNSIVKSEIPGANNKIDGCIISDLCVKATGIAVAFEYKRESGPNLEKVTENNRQAVSANVQIMNDDVRRMFSYGVTIVGDMVKRLLDNRLVFEMEDEQRNPTFYRTVRTLSEYRSCNITGRMTRVWAVNQVSGPETGAAILRSGLVLKDVWLDESSPTERQIQSKIFAAIECRKAFIDTNQCVQNFEPEALKELKHLVEEERYKRYFLTILADLEGQVSRSLPPTARRKRGLLCPDIKHVGTPGSHGNMDRVSSSTPQATRPEEERAAQRPAVPRVFRPKRQYRSVCAELCDTVGKMGSLNEVLKVLSQTLSALRILYFAGWVHRDISSGNVMGYNPDSRGEITSLQAKLSDLEYAKEYSIDGDPAPVDPKTGTPYFMAHEILDNRLLVPMQAEEDQTDQKRSRSLISELFTSSKAEVSKAQDHRLDKSRVIVLHNFQHDLESIFWLALYTVTARINHEPGRAFAKNVFKNTVVLCLDRSMCLKEKISDTLHGCLSPDVAGVANVLEYLRQKLLMHYHLRNTNRLANGPSDDTESYAETHNDFFVTFESLATLFLKETRVALISETSHADVIVTAPRPLKRPRSTRDDGDYRDGHGDNMASGRVTRPSKRFKGTTEM